MTQSVCVQFVTFCDKYDEFQRIERMNLKEIFDISYHENYHHARELIELPSECAGD